MNGMKIEKAIKILEPYKKSVFGDASEKYGGSISVEEIIELLKEQEAVEPKTGHWLKKMPNYPSAIATGGSRTSDCDLCGGWGRKNFKYCPHCGAKMEGR